MGNRDRPKEIKKKKPKKAAAAKQAVEPRERFVPPAPLPKRERS